jgi:hypothetical protein
MCYTEPEWKLCALFAVLCLFEQSGDSFELAFAVLCRFQPFLQGNISSGNQPLRVNYENFNINHTILIQGKTHERWEG